MVVEVEPDVSMAEIRILGNVISKVDEECQGNTNTLKDGRVAVRPVPQRLRHVVSGKMQAHCTPTRLQLKEWGNWNGVRGSAIDMGEVCSLVDGVKASMIVEVQEQGNFELKMMVYLCFRAGVSAWDRKRSHTILAKELADRPIEVPRHAVRIIIGRT